MIWTWGLVSITRTLKPPKTLYFHDLSGRFRVAFSCQICYNIFLVIATDTISQIKDDHCNGCPFSFVLMLLLYVCPATVTGRFY